MKANTRNADKKIHIVYVARYLGKVMYVGEGLPGRQYHLTSGTSHVYNANKHHFEGKYLDVEIVEEGLTKEEALHREKALIDNLLPQWNTPNTIADVDYLSRGNRLKLLHFIYRRFKSIDKLECRGHKLLRFLVGKVDGTGRAVLTGRDINLLSKGEVDSKYTSYIVRGIQTRQHTYMDEFLIVESVEGDKFKKSYQFTPEVMARIGKSDILTKE